MKVFALVFDFKYDARTIAFAHFATHRYYQRFNLRELDTTPGWIGKDGIQSFLVLCFHTMNDSVFNYKVQSFTDITRTKPWEMTRPGLLTSIGPIHARQWNEQPGIECCSSGFSSLLPLKP